MRKLLFVITTNANMGDLALCQEWIADLGREECSFAFVLSSDLLLFLDSRDERFLFDPGVHVKRTILAAAKNFRPDFVIFASNSFWNLKNQKGALFGDFPLSPGDLDVPVLSFDPFEIAFENVTPFSGTRTKFAGVPEWVWALRYMSRSSAEPNARHFCTKRVFQAASTLPKRAIVSQWGGDPDRKTILFPISKNRLEFIRTTYPGYYPHLAALFSTAPCQQAQFFVLSPERVTEFDGLSNVIHLPLVKFEDFLALVSAADIYLTDSFISCVVNAFHLQTPSLVLANSEQSLPLQRGTFLEGRFFPFRVFPYGLVEPCNFLEEKFELSGCYKPVEVLHLAAFARAVQDLLFDEGTVTSLAENCRKWKTDRMALPSPGDLIAEIVSHPPLAMLGANEAFDVR
ncbi:MAG TPA: DUF6365 family protein [Pyrinomonadaceae bacterium]|jgi:hypothetical protein|nr:DUF6365 family protein [Pyrinomonadaceae bacterium]